MSSARKTGAASAVPGLVNQSALKLPAGRLYSMEDK